MDAGIEVALITAWLEVGNKFDASFSPALTSNHLDFLNLTRKQYYGKGCDPIPKD